MHWIAIVANGNRALYSLIAVNLAVVAVIAAFFQWHELRHDRQFELLTAYHTGSANLVESAEADVRAIALDLRLYNAVIAYPVLEAQLGMSAEFLRRDLDDRRGGLDTALHELELLRKEYPVPEFDPPIAAMWAVYGTVPGSTGTAEDFAALVADPGLSIQRLEILAQRLQQISRLHLARYDGLVAESQRDSVTSRRLMLSVIALLMVGGAGAGLAIGRGAMAADVQRRAATTALKAEADMVAAMLDTATAIIVALDRHGRILRFNRGCETVTGYAASEVLGRHVWDFLLPDEAVEPVRGVFARLTAGKLPNTYENVWVARDGSRKTIAWNNSVILDRDGAVDRIVAVGIDVSERKVVEDRLKRTAWRLEHAQRIARIGSYEWDRATDIEYWSDQAYRNLGLEPGSRAPSVEGFYAAIHPDDRETSRRLILAAVTDDHAYEIEFRVVWPDGSIHVLRETAEPVHDEAGAVIGLSGTIQDVTERHDAQRRVHDLSASLANAQRIARLGSWDWNRSTGAEWWSDEIYRIFGLDPASTRANNETLLAVVHPDDRETVRKDIERDETQNLPVSRGYRIVRPDGEERFLREAGEPTFDQTGSVIGMSGTIQDITEQARAAQRLEEVAHRLETALRLARLGTWEWDPVDDTLWLSDQAAEMSGLGTKPVEMTNKGIMPMVHPDDADAVIRLMERTIATAEPYTNQYRLVRPDGDVRVFLEHGEVFRHEATGRMCLRGTIQDVTERQRAQEELARTLKRLADAQTAARIGNWEWDAATDRDWWSEQQFRNYGLESPGGGFVHGERYLDFAHPADRETAKSTVDTSTATATPLDLEFRAIGADGVERWLWVYGVPEADATGRVIRTIGTTQDITIRKLAELELANTAKRLKEAQRIGGIGDWLWDLRDNSEYWSDQSYVIYGLEPGVIRPDGNTYLRFVHPDERERVRLAHERSVAERSPLSLEYRCIDARGEHKFIQTTGECRYDETGVLVQMAGTIQDVTARKLAEMNLAETAERLTAAMRVARLGSWDWNPDTNILSMSEETLRICGLDPDHAVIDNDFVTAMIPEDDQDRVTGLMTAAVASGEPYIHEHTLTRPDGQVRRVLEHAVPLRDAASGTIRLIGIVQDVTEQKQAEQSLKHLADALANAQRIAQVGSWEWDVVADHLVWSDEMYRIAGFRRKGLALNSKFFATLVHPDDLARFERATERALEGSPDYDVEFRMVRPDGEIRIIREQGEVEFDIDGTARTMHGITQDITDLRRLDAALRASEARLNAFFAEAPAGLALYDRDGRYVAVNETLARDHGIPIEAHLGKRPDEVMGSEFGRVLEAGNRRALEQGEKVENAEMTSVRPDGSPIYYVYSRFPIVGADGRPDGIGVVTVDITKRKQAEQELARLNAELEKRVEARTAELRAAQADLVQSERLATLGQLTATVSHELRNPLGAMRTSMYVIEVKTDKGDQRLVNAIGRINRSITRCDRIIDELLDYTRIRDLELGALRIDAWLAGLIDEQPVPEGIAIKRQFKADGVSVRADPDRLRRAIINVFDNACQAMTGTDGLNGGSAGASHRLTVLTRVRAGRAEIVFRDTGPGIASDVLPRIFEPLFSTKNFGVGLGLPTVRQIMEQHDGGVEAGNAKGGGAEFTLWLPLKQKTQDANA